MQVTLVRDEATMTCDTYPDSSCRTPTSSHCCARFPPTGSIENILQVTVPVGSVKNEMAFVLVLGANGEMIELVAASRA